jgi:hypothetical protein
MSTARKTNGAHGCLISPQKVRYFTLKWSIYFPNVHKEVCCWPTNIRHYHGISMNTFEIYQSLKTFGSRKRVYLMWIQFKTVETLLKEMLHSSSCNSGKQCTTGMAAVGRYVRTCNNQRYIRLWDSTCCVAVINARNGHMGY